MEEYKIQRQEPETLTVGELNRVVRILRENLGEVMGLRDEARAECARMRSEVERLTSVCTCGMGSERFPCNTCCERSLRQERDDARAQLREAREIGGEVLAWLVDEGNGDEAPAVALRDWLARTSKGEPSRPESDIDQCDLCGKTFGESGGDAVCTDCYYKARDAEREDLAGWVLGRWDAEVLNRPEKNIYRRILDGTWGQVYRKLTGREMERTSKGEADWSNPVKVGFGVDPARDEGEAPQTQAYKCQKCGVLLPRWAASHFVPRGEFAIHECGGELVLLAPQTPGEGETK